MISYISEIGCAVAANVDGTLRVPHFFQVAFSLPREVSQLRIRARMNQRGMAIAATLPRCLRLVDSDAVALRLPRSVVLSAGLHQQLVKFGELSG
jgi:hypothetical protein